MVALLANHTLPEDDWNGFGGSHRSCFSSRFEWDFNFPSCSRSYYAPGNYSGFEKREGLGREEKRTLGGGGVVSVVCSPLGPSALLRQIITGMMKDGKMYTIGYCCTVFSK